MPSDQPCASEIVSYHQNAQSDHQAFASVCVAQEAPDVPGNCHAAGAMVAEGCFGTIREKYISFSKSGLAFLQLPGRFESTSLLRQMDIKNNGNRSSKYKLRPRRISLFGHFGTTNFGNESTLQAMLCHLRRLMPDAEILCICSAPAVVVDGYKIAAVPISAIVIKSWNPRSPFARLARRLFIGIPSELYRWIEGIMMLRHSDMLIVVGTGLLTDAFGIGAWGPYNTFKWSVIAKLCGCKLMFVSVGAGPLMSRTGRLFVKSALSLANYRSYRDKASLDYLKSLGFWSNDDRVYPDLAFSLPQVPTDSEVVQKDKPVVGLGLMLHAGMYGLEKTTDTHYAKYLETLVVFTSWLLERGYIIRLLIGDVMDVTATHEFQLLLKERCVKDEEGEVVVESIETAQDLLSQLATTDFVVGTRFHNILLALLLNKPSIGIAFHDKCLSLMNGMGLSEYCEDIKTLNATRLIEQFCHMEVNAANLKYMLREKVAQYSDALDEQYRLIFKDTSGQTIIEDTDTRVAMPL